MEIKSELKTLMIVIIAICTVIMTYTMVKDSRLDALDRPTSLDREVAKANRILDDLPAYAR